MRTSKWISLVLAALITLAFAGTALAADKAPETIMRANCGSCHGQLGEGGGTSWIDPSQTAFTIAGKPKNKLEKWAREGRIPQMPAFPVQEINATEMNALTTYINQLPGSYIAEPTAQHEVTITDEDPWYNPMQISVNVGDIVKFTNTGRTYHPVTQLEFVATEGAEGTDSGLLGPNGIYYRTFDTAGQFTFLCKIHPYMMGEVHVGQSFTPPTYSVNTPQPLPAVPGTGEVWVEAQWQDYDRDGNGQYDDLDGVVQVIDASTWNVTHMIPVGNNPHNIWLKKGSTTAVITNWFDNKLSEIDTATKAVTGNEYIAGATPAHIISDFAGNNFYVSVEGSYYVQSFKQSNMSRDKVGWVSGYGPHGIWYGGGKIMTANSMDNTATFLSTGTKITEIATLPADLYPLGAGLNSTGTKGYAGNCLAGTVSIYDLSGTPTKITDLYIGGCPVQAPVTPDDRYAVVPNSPWVTFIDTATDTVAAQLWVGNGAHGAAFSPRSDGNGMYAYITHKKENYISVVDVNTLTHAGDVPLQTTTTGKTTIFGASDTGGNGLAVNPLPAPWQ